MVVSGGFDKERRCGSPRGCITLTPVGAGADRMDAGEDRYGRGVRFVGDLCGRYQRAKDSQELREPTVSSAASKRQATASSAGMLGVKRKVGE